MVTGSFMVMCTTAGRCSGRQINVSVEMWNFEPASLEDIIAIIEAGPTELSEDHTEGYSES